MNCSTTNTRKRGHYSYDMTENISSVFNITFDSTYLKNKINEIGGSSFLRNRNYMDHVKYFLTQRNFNFSVMSAGEAIYIFKNDLIEYPKCECGATLTYNKPRCSFNTFCSCKCPKKNEKATNKRKSTCIEKYGTENVFQSEKIKQKMKETHMSRYGKKHYNQTEEYKERLKSGNIIQNSNKELARKNKLQSAFDSYKRFEDLTVPAFTFDDFNGGGPSKHYKWLCKRCNNHYYNYYNRQLTHWPKCFKCDMQFSDIERPIAELLEKNEIEFKARDRKTLDDYYEIDFLLPKHNIGIEINGLYFHSEKNHRDEKYHIKKTEECAKKNIRLIQIFADEIYHKKKLVISRIKHILKLVKSRIYARKCEIREITKNTSSKFLNKYHIQGSDKAQIKLGAYYNNRLVAVMTFCKLRKALGYNKSIEDTWELSRFCTVFNFNITGIASKLLKHFETNYKPKEIISYADRRWAKLEGDTVYDKIGFELVKITKPNYYYTKDYINRLHRFNFQKHLLKDKLETFDESLTEKQNMINNGFFRIWDCGNYKFVKKINNSSL